MSSWYLPSRLPALGGTGGRASKAVPTTTLTSTVTAPNALDETGDDTLGPVPTIAPPTVGSLSYFGAPAKPWFAERGKIIGIDLRTWSTCTCSWGFEFAIGLLLNFSDMICHLTDTFELVLRRRDFLNSYIAVVLLVFSYLACQLFSSCFTHLGLVVLYSI